MANALLFEMRTGPARRKFEAKLVQCLQDLESQICHGAVDEKKIERPLSPKFWQNFTHKLQLARDQIVELGARQKIDIDVFCSKKMLRGYVKFLLGKTENPPRGWTEWREQLLGDLLRDLFQSQS